MQLNFQREDNLSRWTVSVSRLGIADDACSINLSDSNMGMLEEFKLESKGCEVVHLHGHLHDSASDNYETARYVKELVETGARVVVHTAPGPLADHLRQKINDVLGPGHAVRVLEHV
ncbi:hypothetical protein Q0F99_11435 [Rathayibacter oskolensis]|uniref:hypothetical protein n=1 Tax=Rathayibacter oskolensis TaxID=1891671 RepID=UPI00265DDE5B|nr:hypothetical protein [Rathayibacter oskolensis]WKK70477.1 hypothetical protein Q0F99_11435 [Rathayibacter oskolensis]